MATCYYICNENTPDAQRLEIWDDKGKRDIWLVSRECPEPLGSDLTEEVSKWMIEEYYTEDDETTTDIVEEAGRYYEITVTGEEVELVGDTEESSTYNKNYVAYKFVV